MENNKIKYFSTGELAKLYKINKKTLFHYDEIDLFKPEKVMSNGYRYYSQYQLEVLNVIYILKSIGMPLKDIKEFMNRRNPDIIIELFKKEIFEIEKEITRLKDLQIMMSNKITLISEGKNISDTIFIENQGEEYLILSESIDNSQLFYDVQTYSDHINYCYDHNLNIGFPAGSMIHYDNLIKGNLKEYSYFFTKVKSNLPNESITIKPRGSYLVSYYKGYYDKVYLTYNNMIEYIKNNNLKIVGNAYEDVLIDEVSSKDINNYVIKVSIQVEDL